MSRGRNFTAFLVAAGETSHPEGGSGWRNVTVLFQMAYKLDTGNIFAKMTVAQIALGLSAPAVRRIEHGKRQDNVCREIFR